MHKDLEVSNKNRNFTIDKETKKMKTFTTLEETARYCIENKIPAYLVSWKYTGLNKRQYTIKIKNNE